MTPCILWPTDCPQEHRYRPELAEYFGDGKSINFGGQRYARIGRPITID